MPTDWTQKILDGATFKEFALTVLEATSKHDGVSWDDITAQSIKIHQVEIEKAQKRIKQVSKMSNKAAFNAAARDYREKLKVTQESLQKTAEHGFKLSKMLLHVAAYQPPCRRRSF